MKTLPDGMQAHLDGGATTLCWCWQLTRRDGVVQGFTDHDRDISFDGVTFGAVSGFTASQIESSLGLAVDNLTLTGALSSATLNEADLAAGLYDNAAIRIWRTNWADTGQRVLMRSGTLGEVTRLRAGQHKVNPADDDAVPRDLDEFRRALSRRLEQLVAAPAPDSAGEHE